MWSHSIVPRFIFKFDLINLILWDSMIVCQVKQVIVYYYTVKGIIQFITECKDSWDWLILYASVRVRRIYIYTVWNSVTCNWKRAKNCSSRKRKTVLVESDRINRATLRIYCCNHSDQKVPKSIISSTLPYCDKTREKQEKRIFLALASRNAVSSVAALTSHRPKRKTLWNYVYVYLKKLIDKFQKNAIDKELIWFTGETFSLFPFDIFKFVFLDI